MFFLQKRRRGEIAWTWQATCEQCGHEVVLAVEVSAGSPVRASNHLDQFMYVLWEHTLVHEQPLSNPTPTYVPDARDYDYDDYKTSDYCSVCGESPESASHGPFADSHQYVPPRVRFPHDHGA